MVEAGDQAVLAIAPVESREGTLSLGSPGKESLRVKITRTHKALWPEAGLLKINILPCP